VDMGFLDFLKVCRPEGQPRRWRHYFGTMATVEQVQELLPDETIVVGEVWEYVTDWQRTHGTAPTTRQVWERFSQDSIQNDGNMTKVFAYVACDYCGKLIDSDGGGGGG
jgi:hypothetical protein